MLKRLWLAVGGGWALCCLVPEAMSATGNIGGKVLVIAFMPLFAGWVLAKAARFVVPGTALKTPRR